MSELTVIVFVWAVLACILVGLLIYRTILSNHEEDQLFLDKAVAALEQEQIDVVRRIDRLDPLIRWLGIAAGVLLVLIAGLWLYHGLFGVPEPPPY